MYWDIHKSISYFDIPVDIVPSRRHLVTFTQGDKVRAEVIILDFEDNEYSGIVKRITFEEEAVLQYKALKQGDFIDFKRENISTLTL